MQRRILFITRNFPPVRGGMERYCHDLYHHLSRIEDVALCANRGGKSRLPFFLLRALFVLLLRGRGYTHIHFGDAALTPLLVFAKTFLAARMSVTTYGLDVVYPRRLYQALIPRCLRRADRVICISRATREECIRRGVEPERCVRIPAGIDFSTAVTPACSLADLEAEHGFRVGGRPLLFSIARLVPRKGHAWFVSEVLPLLDPSTHYLIAGAGPEEETIRAAIARQGFSDRVVLLGPVSDDEKARLFLAADWFVMPNFHVEGDLEGFGLTLTEAASHGLPSVAAAVDGIQDAVLEGVTGHLVPEGDAEAFAAALRSPSFDRDRVRARAEAVYSFDRIARRYSEVLAEA